MPQDSLLNSGADRDHCNLPGEGASILHEQVPPVVNEVSTTVAWLRAVKPHVGWCFDGEPAAEHFLAARALNMHVRDAGR